MTTAPALPASTRAPRPVARTPLQREAPHPPETPGTTSTALQLAARLSTAATPPRVPVLASRPRGVLHVVEVPDPGRRTVPLSAVPVCGRPPHRRLYTVPDQPSPELVGHHTNGQRMCHRCLAHLARAHSEGRAGWATKLISRTKIRHTEILTAAAAGGTPYEVMAGVDRVGVIAFSGGRWHVHSAGTGVPVDRGRRVATADRAVVVLAIARELASLPGGPLHVDDGLTLFDRTVLDFAARRYRGRTIDGARNGRRDADITAAFGITPTGYAQHLNALIDDPCAEVYAPQLVHRLRDQRDQRRWRRCNPPLLAGRS